MKVNTGIWGSLSNIIVGLLVVVSIVIIAIMFLPNFRTNERMRKEVMRLDNNVQKEEETYKDLKNSMDSLRNDPKAIERLAREKLGYAKLGETVVRFDEPSTNIPLSNTLEPQLPPPTN